MPEAFNTESHSRLVADSNESNTPIAKLLSILNSKIKIAPKFNAEHPLIATVRDFLKHILHLIK